MKKFLPFILGLLFIFTASSSFGADTVSYPGSFPKIFDNVKVTAGSSKTSEAIYIGDAQGNFSIQYDLSGAGDLKIEYLLSHNDLTWITPSSASVISANATDSTSPDIISFSPSLAETIKIKVTETTSSDNVTSFNLWLGSQ